MQFRIAGYNGFLIREYQLNVYSSVLYLHPDAGRNDPGYYEYIGNGCEYRLKYRVIRLIEIDGQTILEAQIPSLLPLTPLMKPPQGMDSTHWLDRCVDATFNADVDTDIKKELFASMSIFGSLVHDMEKLKQSIPDSIWYEFPLIQELIREARETGLESGMERGMERGQIIFAIDLILESLSVQFQTDSVQELKPLLDNINDLTRLKKLLRAVPQMHSLQDFRNLINEDV